MENWNQLVDVSLQKIERIFDVPGNVRTPLVKKRTLHTPQAPKKVKKSQIRREGLKPRKLTYENENIKRTDEKSNKVWEDSGITLWATTSSTLRMDDVDKENRPESENIVSNSQSDNVEPGSLRDKLNHWMAIIRNAVKFK
ncbi:PREDICTED: uncharacterized protein LOC105359160 isoform X2 [Ceratosolen solmsi marchali]|uniref:Uncharacterized protein LOC105359160 isoform X2 n=1 Tax=Ceratosolen solmsi marchali TaxID=326594 RepID=A0AAJ6VJP6_9HYME|nr:PREDICTED: uncharacterized protein LOC105359160 isoform X2 [Ceratosolen solmsi marchali]